MCIQGIKSIRKLKNLSQDEFAAMLGVCKGTVSAWETGVRTPSVDIINKICEVFETTPNVVWYGEDSEKSKKTECSALERLKASKNKAMAMSKT